MTTIDCSPDDTRYTCNSVCSDWRMEAPPGLRVLLTVPKHHGSNNIKAKDEGGSNYTFAANSFAEDGDYFLSSPNQNVVHMEATFSPPPNDRPPNRQFTVIGEVVNITGKSRSLFYLYQSSNVHCAYIGIGFYFVSLMPMS